MWDFQTEPEFQEKLDWMDTFIREEIEPLDLVLDATCSYEPHRRRCARLIDQLKQEVRDRDLWACHLGPELGGQGYGQVKLALMNEILGRSQWAPIIFGCPAPDTGNAEIIAHYGTTEQKEKWLQPLLDGEVFSCYSMTEPHGGSDPTQFKMPRRARRRRVGHQRREVLLVEPPYRVVHHRDGRHEPRRERVPGHVDDPRAVRHAGHPRAPDIGHLGADLRRRHARARPLRERPRPYENVLGGEGKAFEVAQRRLGGGRIHHAMRTVAACHKYFEMMCERALSRTTKGTLLADKQMVQEQIAESWIEMQEFRLLVLYTAWLIDNTRRAPGASLRLGVQGARAHRSCRRSGRVRPTSTVRWECRTSCRWGNGEIMATVDGPTEVHLVTVARQVIKEHKPSEDNWPTQFRPRRLLESRRAFDEIVSRRLDPSAQEELSALVQHGQANDEAVKRFEEYLELTANS